MQVRKNSLGFNKEVRKKDIFLFKEDILSFDLPGKQIKKINVREA